MLQQIHHYLFQYKTVAIPEVGTFEVAHAPATLDVANQMVAAPQPVITFSPQSAVSQHQLQAFADALGNDAEEAGHELARFGEAFRNGLVQQPFIWEGVGAFRIAGNNQVQFSPNGSGGLLLPVPAQKVLRENVQHNVLVGDQELQYSAGEFEDIFNDAPSRPWLLAVCWIVVACAAAFIAYYLYVHNWSVQASGMRQKVVVESSPVQHR